MASNALTLSLLVIQAIVKYLCVNGMSTMANIADSIIDVYKVNSSNATKKLELVRYPLICKTCVIADFVFLVIAYSS